jgi:tetratricopeptide (TPR) repeat protein
MKLFERNSRKGKTGKPSITEPDRLWVDDNLRWLLRLFGRPGSNQITISEKYFPQVFGEKEIKIENLISDCANHLGLDPHLFSYEIYEDIRDTEGLPYALAGRPRDCDLLFDEESGKYVLAVAKNVFNYPNWLIAASCQQFSKAKLVQRGVKYDKIADANVFLYLAAVYFGFGVIIAQSLIDMGVSTDTMWETKWTHVADIPGPVIAYALAAVAKIRNEENPDWGKLLPADVRKEFSACIKSLNESSEDIFGLKQIDDAIAYKQLMNTAHAYNISGDFSQAVATYEKTLSLSITDMQKSNAFNGIGYNKLRLGDHRGSISDFENSVRYNPNYGYANDNLGFALIMTGEQEKGLEYLNKAIQTGNNHNSYSLRNRALYFQVTGDIGKAKEFFQKAFDTNKPVDLLDFYYGKFLMSIGDIERGIKHIQKSADLGEPEGIEEIKRLNPA